MCSVFTATLDRIFDCLLASMAAMQAEDISASFLFVGDLNWHQEWLGSTTTNRHGAAAFDFVTVSGCDQLVVGPTHARGGTLDLLTTDVPDLMLYLEWQARWLPRMPKVARSNPSCD